MNNKKSKKFYDFLKTIKGFKVITIISYIFVAILLAILIWSAVRLSYYVEDYYARIDDYNELKQNIIKIFKTKDFRLDSPYNQIKMFKYGSIIGVSSFLIIIININIFAYWSYSNVYIPELKDKKLVKNWFRNFQKNNKVQKTDKQEQEDLKKESE
ncbi:hypothetical protein [Ureaplasma urealyticum]|uniref:Uncharacterized protein n=3 Tax=Ureaplasma urealyticum TaxID=2130 RepID=A0AAP9AC59_UREUR|nr:hypothetical protein [Ureaplasma urealyticum]EDX53741.1 conserved hypothetical protein [Ureaplasma urealyticum serovar 9 str. ATCC 33175]ACI59924.1 conserved hypothetical protein [Ureaplasma urealyticum serovar 10 str. ATCC 33699]EDT49363.1 conserved hypothetical protein [Ureaplasma urealyticum serovar 13 str. ATCC 33698]EDU06248.1 conserved hypothetical protein [Ureaplasma urealyticum serovar 5 str. ATCC 27817]EDU57154.1 conserved hypothetical protein [Ureaplasma urealyticum serovar 7 str.